MLPRITIIYLLLLFSLAACGAPAGAGTGLPVVASTTIVGDVLAQVGGEYIELTVLFPTGADPHTFDPRPQDITAISNAKLIFLNGLGLEESIQTIIDTNATGEVIHVSDGVHVLALDGTLEPDAQHGHESGDPHTWTDPNNVIVWTENISAALSRLDPSHASTYRHNADAYIASLRDLDAWIRSEVSGIPPGRRKLVTDHQALGYFAKEYGFEQVGTLIGSFSTNASPSAQEIAALEDLIRAQNVPAVFVGTGSNSNLAEQVAQDTGITVIPVYTGSLSAPGGDAGNYLALMKYNVNAIVAALK
jgi:manganese/iron transport system substrate-binding protein